MSVFGFSYDFLAVASTLALIQSPLIHIEPLTCTDTPLVVEYTHRTKSLLCVFFFILFSVVRLCMPYLFSVEPESTEIRTDIVSFNRTLARNCCFIKSLSTFSFIELIRKIFHTKKFYINFLDFQSDYSGLFLKIVSKFFLLNLTKNWIVSTKTKYFEKIVKITNLKFIWLKLKNFPAENILIYVCHWTALRIIEHCLTNKIVNCSKTDGCINCWIYGVFNESEDRSKRSWNTDAIQNE